VKPLALVLLAGMFSLTMSAQSIENIRYAQEGSRMIITYDLVSNVAQATYTVSLLSSHNNFSAPATHVTGNAGKGQHPGTNKRIEWDIATELRSFSGQLVIELLGHPEIAKLALKEPFLSPKPKAGKEVMINWVGGGPADVKIDIYKDGKLVSSLGERKNTGSFGWKIPEDHDTGDGFKLRLTSGADHVESIPFNIKGKTNSKLLIIGSAAAVTTTVIVWLVMRPLPDAPNPD
jgi:hypothetical protein